MTTINRRNFLRVSAAAGLAGGFADVCARSAHAAGEGTSLRPNLVFVMADQFRPQALGFRGEDPTVTPHLDRFAGESLVLSQTVSNTPICSPFRAMLMTGNYYTKTNVPTNCVTGSCFQAELRREDTCFTDVLHAAGYHQAYFGKWHLEHPRPPYVPSGNNNPAKNRCWEEWTSPDRRHGVDLWHAYNTWDDHFHPHYWTNSSTRDKRLEVSQWSPIHETNMAIRYIENQGGKMRDATKPFSVIVSMNPPHTPYNLVPEKYKEIYKDLPFEKLCNRPNVRPGSPGERIARGNLANYFACVSGVDDQFGRLLAAIKAQGLSENTVVVFCSDHGNCVGCHDKPTKGNIFDESLRIPMMIRYPGKVRPREDKLLFSVPDIYPSVTGLMGLASQRPETDGIDYSGLFVEDPACNVARPTSSVYAMQQHAGTPRKNTDIYDGARGVRTDRYTLEMVKHATGEIRGTSLYDNEKDPYQLEDIAERSPALVRELVESQLNPWLRKIDDPWLTNTQKS